MKRLGPIGLVVFLAVGFLLDYPWGDWVGHTHWAKVGWIPFYSWPVRPLDICQNLLLFAPVGVASALTFRKAQRWAALLTLVASVAGEATQLYSHLRFPSATDVVCNVAGAWMAARVSQRYLTCRRT